MRGRSQHVGVTMETNLVPNTSQSSRSSASSLKKLKREAAQRRKAQARSLKLRSEEQERLQRLEIDALVEQQRLERLEGQRHKDNNERQIHEAFGNFRRNETKSKSHKQEELGVDRNQLDDKKHKSTGVWPRANELLRSARQQNELEQQASLTWPAPESRRHLARGPRSGVALDCHHPMLQLEDHRVVSTEYQAAGTQALMRVTLLAAGFVIGSRGISARLIGQVTGAIIQSWTEPCRPDLLPLRLFKIQGKKAVVQAAVSLIEHAVNKYRDLCDCKRKGEFVQREHVINGVEFYYQPPPRKAFAVLNDQQQEKKQQQHQLEEEKNKSKVEQNNAQIDNVSRGPLPIPYPPPHNVWLQHLQAQHKKKQAEQELNEQKRLKEIPAREEQSSKEEEKKVETFESIEASAGGVQSSIASLEHALQSIRLEQRQHKERNTSNFAGSTNLAVEATREETNDAPPDPSIIWAKVATTTTPPPPTMSPVSPSPNLLPPPCFQMGSSLFSIFGNGGLPMPIPQHCTYDDNSVSTLLKPCVTSTATTPFDFPKYDFFRGVIPALSIAPRDAVGLGSYNYGHGIQSHENLCVICLEQPSGVCLLSCGHRSFCLSCVQGLSMCPLCRQKIVGWQPF